MFVGQGKTWEFAYQIDQHTTIPTIFVGQINTTEAIETIEKKYNGKYMAIGRALVADPDFIGKHLGLVQEIYRPCLACSEACLGGVKAGKGLGCLVNPEVNNPNLLKSNVTPNPKKIAVIGGGLAGMEAALRLHNKGHLVTIFEKNQLGGQFNLAWLPPKKKNLKKIVDYYISILKEYKIPVIHKEVNAKDLVQSNFNEVVIATGARPFIPDIKGLIHYHWSELLEDKNLPHQKKLLIIGGGLIGTELASKLIDANNEVVLVEMLDDIARGMEMIERKLTLKKLQNSPAVHIYKNHRVIEVEEDQKSIVIEGTEKIRLTDIDMIVVATGMISNNQLVKELEGKINCHLIGDAIKPAKAQDAIRSAYQLAIDIG